MNGLRFSPGDTVASLFRIEALIACGGMGEIYRARDLALDRPCALKIARRSLGESEHFDRQILEEARVQASLDHPAIPTVYASFNAGPAFFVMPWLDGENLRVALRSRVPVSHSLAIVHRVASALAHLHARGFVHRDVKPENVVLVSNHPHRAHLIDFGIAERANGPGPGTRAFGTVRYASPEQLRGERASSQTDVYALGLILHELVTGLPPPLPRDFTLFECAIEHDARHAPNGPDLLRLLAQMLRREATPTDAIDVVRAIQPLFEQPRRIVRSGFYPRAPRVPSGMHAEASAALHESPTRAARA